MTDTVHIRGNEVLKEVSGQDKEKRKILLFFWMLESYTTMLIKEAEEV